MFEYYLTLFIEAVFIENIALAYFLGMCTFLAISKSIKPAIGLGLTVVVLLTITVPINNLIFTYFLKPGALIWMGIPDSDLKFVGLISYIGVIAAVVQILEIFLDRYIPFLYNAFRVQDNPLLRILLPLLQAGKQE